ncbi:MAG: serine/threonine-protein kinase [Cyanobacteriota bacterium]
MSLYCSQGHANTPGSRFCNWCGEALSAPAGGQELLGDRYKIVRELGHGGFGRTYLAEDQNRFRESCVLKEFAPQVQSSYALQKAEELFQREAGVLYQLQHPQIPRFRELCRTQFNGKPSLFLVQDYVDGPTYRQLLDQRRLQGQTFSEAEVTQLMRDLLPVLHYIHSLGVVHRDISPDNLILRTADQLPVLIDFGGVKQVAASVASQYTPSAPTPTRVGKVGYAPDEQMDHGQVYAHSDLYALAVTVLVLLTGKEPSELGDLSAGNWRQWVKLSPALSRTLMKMLADSPRDRFQTAAEVLQALQGLPGANPSLAPTPGTLPPAAYAPPIPPGQPAPPSTQPTYAVSPKPPTPPAPNPVPTAAVPAPAPRPPATKAPLGGIGIGPILATGAIAAGVSAAVWGTRDVWLSLLPGGESPPDVVETVSPSPEPEFSAEERQRKAALTQRRQDLGVDSGFLVRITDTTFHQRYPELGGRSLSKGEEDAEWRERWDAIAAEWLDVFEQELSSAARRKLGKYSAGDRAAWRDAVNKLYVSSRALNDVTDAQFFNRFPDLRGQDFINAPIGQVWQGMAADQVAAMQSGKTLSRIEFAPGALSESASGSLKPGEGRIYIANLQADQPARFDLETASGAALLSIYPPSPSAQVPPILEDSETTRWAGTLPQSGYYEFVVVPRGRDGLRYRLNLAVDRVITTPTSPDRPTPRQSDEPVQPGT